MKTYLLDSNVISEWWKSKPDSKVMAWTERNSWLVPVVVIAEIQEGAERDPSIKRRLEISARLETLVQEVPGVIVSWDAETALKWARLAHSPEVRRKPQSLWDSLIDALAVRHGYTVATRNTGDFRHADTCNPWLPQRAGE